MLLGLCLCFPKFTIGQNEFKILLSKVKSINIQRNTTKFVKKMRTTILLIKLQSCA